MPIAGKGPKKGGVLAALRRSALVGADLDIARLREEGRPLYTTVDDQEGSAVDRFVDALRPGLPKPEE